jgi:hypothetical protein
VCVGGWVGGVYVSVYQLADLNFRGFGQFLPSLMRVLRICDHGLSSLTGTAPRDPQRIRFLVVGSRSRCGHPLHCKDSFPSGALERFRALIFSQLLPDALRTAPALPRLLLIQRRSGDARRLVTQFSDAKASAQGIDVVALEGVTLAYQVQLVYRYQTVAMMHGAALANFIWLRPGATLIDMRPSELEPWPGHPWPHGYSLGG